MRTSRFGLGSRSRGTRRSTRSLLAMLAMTLMLTLGPLVPTGVAAAPSEATLVVVAPKQATLGQPFDIRLVILRAQDAAGFESSVLFDTNAAEFDDLQTASSYFLALGRDIGQLSAPQTSYGAAIGFYSCPVANCLDNNAPRHSRGGNGVINLGKVTLVGNEPGALDVTFDAAKLVDSTGASIPLTVQSPTVTVQIGASPSTAVAPGASAIEVPHPAPPGRWKLPNEGKGTPGPFSTTGSGSVTNQDVMQVAMAWQNLREHANPCGPGVEARLDVNHDGCIDVSDVEAVASNYTATTSSSSAPSGASPSAQIAAGATFVVNSTGDEDDANKGDGICQTATGTCTLRAAIAEANNTSGPNTITFNIPGGGVQTIHLNSPLHSLWDTSGPTTIDGYTQPGASPNTDPLADNAKIMIQLEGAGEDQYDALPITSPGNLIRGLSFYKFQRSFWIYGNAADNNTIVGCFVGTNAAGTYGASQESPTGAFGFHIEQGAGNTTIGTPTLADRNVISGNGRSGVGVWHYGSNHTVIQNNIVGLSPDGTRRVPNQLHGLDMNYGSQNNLYGGTGLHEHNVVSGNDSGIDISHTGQTSNNQVIGNYVGTDLTGNSAPSYAYNTKYGIRLEDGVQYNTIADNVIGGSSNHASGYNFGIWIANDTTNHNTIKNNRIGVTLDGTPNPNGIGIIVYGQNNTIGPGNIIANNLDAGIDVQSGAVGNTITRNSIYANGGGGIKLESGGNNDLAAPQLSSATTTSATGTACGGCKIELFVADGGSGDQGQGKKLTGTGTAGSGGSIHDRDERRDVWRLDHRDRDRRQRQHVRICHQRAGDWRDQSAGDQSTRPFRS